MTALNVFTNRAVICGRVVQCWLDHDKPIVRQLPQHRLDFRFVVKFYTPDPGLLEEEYTRSATDVSLVRGC